MAREEKSSEEKSAKEKAVEHLSKDNQNWLKSWEKENWLIDLVDLEWIAEKKFVGDTEKHIITGFGSITSLLAEIEKVEAARKISSDETSSDSSDEAVEPRIVIRECRVDLDDEEVKERTERMMQAMDEKDDAERKFASVKDSHKANIKSVDFRIQSLRNTVNTRVEWRDVECKEVFDYDKWTVTVVRSDTGETVEKRPMTSRERQSKLF